jgi:hypothetical protein
VLTEDALDETGARLEQLKKKSFRNLAQQSGAQVSCLLYLKKIISTHEYELSMEATGMHV